MSATFPLETDEDRRARHLFMLKALTERSFDLALEAADLAAEATEAADTKPGPAPKTEPDYHQRFQRYVAITRQLITAEHRIADRPAATTRRSYKAKPDLITDPRRPRLRQLVHDATKNSPDIRRAAHTTLDEVLGAETAATTSAADLLKIVFAEYRLPFSLAHLPDEFLVAPTDGPPPLPKPVRPPGS